MLARSLERTNGPEEDGVRIFKDELRDSVLKKESNRFFLNYAREYFSNVDSKCYL